ncbi:MAG TPA: response regulator [Fluviicoccus sp.]|nr:response regulator [Fluviicoccus sp.]
MENRRNDTPTRIDHLLTELYLSANSIAGSAESLLRTPLSPEQRVHVEKINTDVRQLRALGASAPDLARGLSGTPLPEARGPFPETFQSLQGVRVLLVEDNLVNQQVAEALLRRMGVKVLVAADGREALALLEEQRVDVVLMDLQMPVMDGHEAARRIRATPQIRHLPIIVFSAHAWADVREDSLAAGMNDFVSKPVKPAQLCETLTRWLHAGNAFTPATAEAVPASPAPPTALVDDNLFDPVTLSELFEGDELRLSQLTHLFFSDTCAGVDQMYRALELEDRATLRQLAHKFKSSSRSMGADEVADRLTEVERLADAGPAEAIQPLLEQVRRLLERR